MGRLRERASIRTDGCTSGPNSPNNPASSAPLRKGLQMSRLITRDDVVSIVREEIARRESELNSESEAMDGVLAKCTAIRPIVNSALARAYALPQQTGGLSIESGQPLPPTPPAGDWGPGLGSDE